MQPCKHTWKDKTIWFDLLINTCLKFQMKCFLSSKIFILQLHSVLEAEKGTSSRVLLQKPGAQNKCTSLYWREVHKNDDHFNSTSIIPLIYFSIKLAVQPRAVQESRLDDI